ncbi:hypothetical protein AYL99_00648 [Fonsecaea erecta]|uniref:Uncharacterized protein n=1 Tax=Fonsecaea erecta TaxID=1367422 RepID=A0A178ZZ65_9EURO|nr:hypothetical protein AYL99_00648 [Fonsecaea erecta]OAP64676.1 hypothetical protein AYL99_00648 [Fonsecaea erecta]
MFRTAVRWVRNRRRNAKDVARILLAITLERRRHRHIMRAHGLTRGLSKYHRPKLSACEQNYSHVAHPTTPLRRSVQLPFGVISIGADSVGEDEEKQLNTAVYQPDDYIDVLRPRSKRGIRRPFSGHPLYIPKTRRHGKLRKAVPLERMQKSPLSAITEFSDPSTGGSPVTPEFPAEPVTVATHEKPVSHPGNHTTTQWPLSDASTRNSDIIPTEVMSIAVRESVLMRKGGPKHSQAAAPQSAAVPRSVSLTSVASLAPDEPLPPLPTIQVPRQFRARASTTSLDTVGSSILGTDLGASKLELNRQCTTLRLRRDQEFLTPRLQAPPAKQTIHGLCTGQPSIRSLHPTVDTDDLSPGSTIKVSTAPPFPTIIVQEESYKVIDASDWDLPPLRIGKTRHPPNQQNRHSMIEQSRSASYRAASDSATSLLIPDEDILTVPEIPKRPNSVATGNPLKWDRQGSFATKRHSLSALDGPKRGHKRQNCVRITNLACPDPRPQGAMRLPDLREEQNQLTCATTLDMDESFQALEIKQPQPTFKPVQSELSTKSSTTPVPSPFRNAPILTPTPRRSRKQYIQRPDSATSGTPRPDSEVLSPSDMAILMSKRCNTTPRQWPLSLSSRADVLLGDTPPSSQASGRFPFESPTLPSPALDSASLFPRKSLVKGPRGPRNLSQGSHAASVSPLQNKTGPSYRVTKARDSSSPGEVALRKSVMMLRSMDSEGCLLDQRNTKISNHGAAGNDSPDIVTRLSPLVNKRVMGLRSASCTPSSMSAPRPGSLERQPASRGSSPLARSGSNMNKPPQSRAAARTSLHSDLDLPPPVMCVSPSVMSIGGGSIWEDVSVRGDSPEPEVHVAPLALRSRTDHNQQRYPSASTFQAARGDGEDFFDTRQGGGVGHGQYLFPPHGAPFIGADAENSHLVQQLERAVSSGRWNHYKDSVGPGDDDDPYVNNVAPTQYHARGRRDIDTFQLPYHTRKEIGLGLRLGSSTVRSP